MVGDTPRLKSLSLDMLEIWALVLKWHSVAHRSGPNPVRVWKKYTEPDRQDSDRIRVSLNATLGGSIYVNFPSLLRYGLEMLP
jgi:hypothetical protein